jgi:hypothetical protein
VGGCGLRSKGMDAVSSALHVAAALGMEVTDPHLLRSTNNTVIWLRPTPVVAKVALAGSSTLEWELVVASALGGMEAPVVGPSELAAPVVHHYGGWAMTFWPYHAQTGLKPDPVALGRALGRLHDALDEAARLQDWSLPAWDRGPREVMSKLGDEDFAPELNADDRNLLAEVLCRSREIADLSARQRALHGSPHGFNLLMVEDEPAFIDFETVCYGPVEWDLCHLDSAAAYRYPLGYDFEALGLARLVVSAMTSALCWEGIDRGEDMRFHAEHHLAVVRGASG